jgi:S-adenosylmethionine:tRNA ribosyltransferase-isomerase
MAREIKIEDFFYELPDEKIAKFPLEKRSDSKLLVYQNGLIQDSAFNSIINFLPKPSTLVFNNTKVVSARLLFDNQKNKRKPIEIFILDPANNLSVEEGMLQKGKSKWNCLIGNLRHFSNPFIEKSIKIENSIFYLRANNPTNKNDAFTVEFEWDLDATFAEILNHAGIIPLPPYLKRIPDETDKNRYQTVYAKKAGSVAAPTAGLHFTDEIINEFKNNQISTEYLVLHVGAGTFKPVKSLSMKDHNMHSEEIIVSKKTIYNLINNTNNLIAVGTTSLRTLESLFWIGLKLHQGLKDLEVHQWDAYDLKVEENFDFSKSLTYILKYLEINNLDSLTTKTELLIAPGYKIRSIKGIITNFHQPNSTLLLLIASLVGDNWREIYQHALKNNYRFLSYGDSSLLLV